MPLFTFFFGREKWSAINKICAKLHGKWTVTGRWSWKTIESQQKTSARVHSIIIFALHTGTQPVQNFHRDGRDSRQDFGRRDFWISARYRRDSLIWEAKILPRCLGISAAKTLSRFLNLGGQNPAANLAKITKYRRPKSCRESHAENISQGRYCFVHPNKMFRFPSPSLSWRWIGRSGKKKKKNEHMIAY